ncbi:MAG: RNA 2',3'-cyclic phosphodiesterase [Oligoflexus sp.]
MAFLAFQPSLEQRRLLGAAIENLQTRFPGLVWEHWQDLHITIKFIAGWNRLDLLRVTEVWQQLLEKTPAFELRLAEFGAFISHGRAQILWLGVEESCELKHLAELFDGFLEDKFQIPRNEKPFRPHLTLARVVKRAAFPERDWYALPRLPMSFAADEIRLMKRRSGTKTASVEPLYEVLAATRLPISRT